MPSTSLTGVDRCLQRLDRDVRWHRPLDDDAGDARVGVHAVDRRFQLLGGEIGGIAPLLEGDAGDRRLGALVAHIDIDGGDVADGDGDQLWRETLRCGDLGGGAYFRDDAGCDRPALQVAIVGGAGDLGHGRPLMNVASRCS